MAAARSLGNRKTIRRNAMRENLILIGIMSPVIVYLILFCYVPMYGIVISFQNYTPGSSFFAMDQSVRWVGLKHFVSFFTGEYFWRLTRNTLMLGAMKLAFGFLVPIVFALLLNEVRISPLRKFYQTASYLPYFISVVVVAGMVLSFLETNGVVNRVIRSAGLQPVRFTTDPSAFPWVYTITDIWKNFGWNSILFLATMAGVDPGLYEAAKIDGANRFQQMLHVTLPAISATIFVLLIMNVGALMSANYEFILLIYNRAIYETSDVYGTYVYRMGIEGGKFSQSSAIGLIGQMMNLILLVSANAVARKVNGYSLW